MPESLSSRRSRTCGLRFSILDAVAIAVCGAATWLAWPVAGVFSLLMPYALAHFLLFCNVFRIRRAPELIWAAAFVANMAVWQFGYSGSILRPLLIQLPLTAVLIGLEMRRPTYHGIWCRKLNSANIDRYLAGEWV